MMKELFLRDSAKPCVESPFLPPQKISTQITLKPSLQKVSKYLWQTILQGYTIAYFLWILRNCWNLLKILRFYYYLRFYGIHFCFLHLLKCGLPRPLRHIAMTNNKIAVISSLQDFAESFCKILCVKYGEIPHREDFYA